MPPAERRSERFVLPRPAEWRHGARAPWLEPGATLPDPLSSDAVAACLRAAGYQPDAPSRPAVAELPGVPQRDDALSAAVLVALFDDADGCRVLFERRSNDLRRHRGEVSFPGGLAEPGEDAITTALREADEELGVAPGDVRVLGRLTPLRTYSGQVVIEPVVGAMAQRPQLRVQAAEVDYAFDVALAALLQEGAFREELWRRDLGGEEAPFIPIYVFEVDGETIWGATARILAELCALLVRQGPPARAIGSATTDG